VNSTSLTPLRFLHFETLASTASFINGTDHPSSSIRARDSSLQQPCIVRVPPAFLNHRSTKYAR
jgi:hypothetical protein